MNPPVNKMEVYGSSEYVFTLPEGGDSAFDYFHTVKPFVDKSDSETVKLSVPAMLCTHCGAYLNLYCLFDATTLTWTCSLCKKSNPRFQFNGVSSPLGQDPLRESSPEMRSDSFEVHDSIAGSKRCADRPLFVIAIDTALCVNGKARGLLLQSLSSLQPGDKISILIYGQAINLLRLLSVTEESAIISDSISSRLDQSSSLDTLIKQQLYVSRVDSVLQEMDALEAAVEAIAHCRRTEGKPHGSRSHCCIDVLLRAVAAMGRHINLSGVQLVLFSHQSFRLSPACLAAVNVEADGGAPVGAVPLEILATIIKSASLDSCWIDVFQVGTEFSDSGCLETIASAGGGSFVSALSASDPALMAAISTMLRTSCFPSPESSCVFEVRTCAAFAVEKIIGPISSLEEAALKAASPSPVRRSDSGTEYSRDAPVASLPSAPISAESLCVDKNHLSYTLLASQQLVESQNVLENSFVSLLRHASESVVGCAINRCHSNIELMVQLRPNHHDRQMRTSYEGMTVGTGVGVGMGMGMGLGNGTGLGAGAAATASPLSPRGGDSRCTGFGIIQYVCRYLSADKTIRITRVKTTRVSLTNDFNLFMDRLREDVWATCQCKQLVAAHHEAAVNSSMSWQSFAANVKEARKSLRKQSTSDVLSFLESLVRAWKWDHSEVSLLKLESVLRHFFHLSEGALLDGPMMHAQEAFVLRSYFLKCNVDSAGPFVFPALTLLTMSSSNESSASPASMSVSEMTCYPETTSLFADAVAVFDGGDVVVVRPGHRIESLADVPALAARAEALAVEMAKRRFPPSRVAVLHRAGSPSDRLLFSRLNPAHTDSLDSVSLFNPVFKHYPGYRVNIAEVASQAMPTDQASFSRFLHSHFPKFAARRLVLYSNHVEFHTPTSFVINRQQEEGPREPVSAYLREGGGAGTRAGGEGGPVGVGSVFYPVMQLFSSQPVLPVGSRDTTTTTTIDTDEYSDF